ncbi:MAG: zinc ribbon domain-containing protein [Candidatus Dojkabacteria bacterium]|jgi:hypothetical protein
MEKAILDFLDGVTKINFGFVWSLFGVALLAFWLVVLYWVWLDSGDRITNKGVRIAYVLLTAVLFVPGLIIYLLIRPSQTIEEIYWADLERRYLKYETAELGDCPRCGAQLYPGFTYCPDCRFKLKIKCPVCEVEMDKKYKYCPSCGNEMYKRVKKIEEEAPSREVMQEHIQASKDEATEVVESKKVRYSERKGIAVELGDKLISLYEKVFKKKEEKEGKAIEEENKEKEVSQPKKKGKKKKHKRRG